METRSFETADEFRAWYRQTAVYLVMNAKREETSTRRLAKLIADSAAGRRLEGFT